MSLSQSLLEIDTQDTYRPRDAVAGDYICDYVKYQLAKIHAENYDEQKKISKQPGETRLINLFEKNYAELRQAVVDNQFVNLHNIHTLFGEISKSLLNKYKQRLPELKSSGKDKLPSHACLSSYLKFKDLEGLKIALSALERHYYNKRDLYNFINKRVERVEDETYPLLQGFVLKQVAWPPTTYANDEQIAKFAYQAIQLLVQHGADIHWLNDSQSARYDFCDDEKHSLLFSVIDRSFAEDLLSKTIFEALIDAGADLTVTRKQRSLLNSIAMFPNLDPANIATKCFYFYFLVMECGVEGVQLEREDHRRNFKSLSREREEKINVYTETSNFISGILLFPKPLAKLTLEYERDYSPAFLRSISHLTK